MLDAPANRPFRAAGQLDRRKVVIIAVSFGFGLGLERVPEVFSQAPQLVQNTVSFAAATSGLSAIALSLLKPETAEPTLEEGTA